MILNSSFYLTNKFSHFIDDIDIVIDYLFHSNSHQQFSGEELFRRLSLPGQNFFCFLILVFLIKIKKIVAIPIKPLEERYSEFSDDLPVTLVVGERSWVCKYSTFRFFKKIIKKRSKNLSIQLEPNYFDHLESKFESPSKFKNGILELKSEVTNATFYEFESASHHLYLDKASLFNDIVISLKSKKK